MDLNSIIVLVLIFLVFAGFLSEKFSPDLVSLFSVAVLLVTGILGTKEFLQVFSNGAAITIVMMFIISLSLERTGCLQIITNFISRIAGQSYVTTMVLVMILAMTISAFMNNTPVVIMMTPVVIALCNSINVPASKMLIPLSFAAIFGGSATLIGTSTNILVGDLTAQHYVMPIGMFEMTTPALIFASVGILYMVVVGRFLLPERHSISSVLDGQPKRQFIAEIVIPKESGYLGKKLKNTDLEKKQEKIIDIIRDGDSLMSQMSTLRLEYGDRIIIETNVGDILGLQNDGEIEFKNTNKNIKAIKAAKRVVMEASIPNKSSINGKFVSVLNLRRKYGVYILAINQHEKNFNKDFDNIKLGFGDTLLIEGDSEGIARLIDEGSVINLNHPKERALRKSKAPIAFLAMFLVVTLAALKVMPIAGLAIIGAVVVMATRCIDPEDAYKSIDWKILFLIFGMLGLSMGMHKTGVTDIFVSHFIDLIQNLEPVYVLLAIYIMTSVLTEMISNNAVVVLLTPLVLDISHQLGYDSRPFIMALMFASSASFATPIGYQTNTFVYSAGGYKFFDFIKIGLPLNIIFAIMSALLLPIFFPF